jgi:hypothetical protein
MTAARGMVCFHDSMITFSPARTFRYLVTTLRAASRRSFEAVSAMSERSQRVDVLVLAREVVKLWA